MLAQSEHQLLLAFRDNRCVGRSLVHIDKSFNGYYRTKTGMFGSFECERNEEAAGALLKHGERWLHDRGMNRIRGPINPIAENWGFFLKGKIESPVFLAPYNPTWYNEMLKNSGYRKAKDLMAYEANGNADYDLPSRYTKFRQILLNKNPNLTVRCFNPKKLFEDAEHIRRLSNTAYADNWGYVPVERAIMFDMIKRLRPILDPSAIWFVEDEGIPVGYCLGFPNFNIILKRIGGHVFPLGFLTILRRRRVLKDYRLFGLAIDPGYHGRGLDVLLYIELYSALKPKGIRLEANYILEDNHAIRNALEKLKMVHTKTYRVYEKEI